MDRPKLLVLSAPIGAGHIRAAEAVCAAVKTLAPQAECRLMNVFECLPQAACQLVLKSYLKALDIMPSAYGALYGWGNTSRIALWSRSLFSRYLAARMRAVIDRYQPTAIVCTHATPAGLAAQLISRYQLKIPVVAVVTDFVVHRLWVYPEIPHYCVAHEGMRQFLNAQGITDDKIMIAGIPVHAEFVNPQAEREAMLPFALVPEHKTIVVMGGGAGLLPMAEILKASTSLAYPVQWVVVTGHNRRLERDLQALAPTLPYPVHVLGYVDYTDVLMRKADILISKPGGVTTAEALCNGTPLLIFRPIPGQEEANTRFLLDHQAAVRADSLAELFTLLERLCEPQSALLQALKSQAKRLGQPEAAMVIARKLLGEQI